MKDSRLDAKSKLQVEEVFFVESSRKEKRRRHQPSFFLLRPEKWGEVGKYLF